MSWGRWTGARVTGILAAFEWGLVSSGGQDATTHAIVTGAAVFCTLSFVLCLVLGLWWPRGE